jgi:hypothetical protein
MQENYFAQVINGAMTAEKAIEELKAALLRK